MIEHLQPSLAPRAQLARVNWILRAAFELFCQAHLDDATFAVAYHLGVALHHAHLKPASRRAQGADAGLPDGDARGQVLFRNETDELLIRRAAGIERSCYARQRRNLDKVTPFHKNSPESYSLVMTGGAINRHPLLLVAFDTKTHVQIYFAFRGGLLSHIAMAGGTVYSCADVRRMIESHMGRGAVVIYPNPWNVFAARLIGGNLLDLRVIRIDGHVAGHTERHIGNLCFGSLIDPHVARCALQPVGQMNRMRVCDRLHRMLRVHIEKIFESTCSGWMCSGEYTAGCILR